MVAAGKAKKAKSAPSASATGGPGKAARLESKLAKLAAVEEVGAEGVSAAEVPKAAAGAAGKGKKQAKAAGAAAAASSSKAPVKGRKQQQEGDDAAAAAAVPDPASSADFVALSSAVRAKLGGKPKASEKKARPKAATNDAAAAAAEGRVVYLGHVPHGFYEEQMRGFFSQFGEVRQLRLSRSKKTAKSRGYAFIEFGDKEVAQVVAETMDGYYLDHRKLVCHLLEPAKAHPALFEGADKPFRVIPWRRLERERRAAPKTEQDARKCLSRLLRGDRRRKGKLAKLGIDYDYDGYEATAHLAYVRREQKEGPPAKALEPSEPKAGAKKRGRADAAAATDAAAAATAATASSEGKKAPATEAEQQQPKKRARGAAAAAAAEPAKRKKGAGKAQAPVASGKKAAGAAGTPAKKAAGAKKQK